MKKKIYIVPLICLIVIGCVLFSGMTNIAFATETVAEDPFNYQDK